MDTCVGYARAYVLTHDLKQKIYTCIKRFMYTHMYWYVHIYMCIHIYIYTYMSAYMYTYAYIYLHIYIYAYTCRKRDMFIYTHIWELL